MDAPVATLGYGHGCGGCRFSWDDSWDDASRNPSVAVAISAITRVICAGSAHVALGHASCKRQASGSNPLTGSQVRGYFSLVRSQLAGQLE
jgi:hypothetical protein